MYEVKKYNLFEKMLNEKIHEFCGFEVENDLMKVVCKYPHNRISSAHSTMIS